MKDVSHQVLEQSMPAIKSSVLMLVVALGVWQLMEWVKQPSTYPIHQVRIEGVLTHVTRDQVSNALETLVQTGYFSMNADAIIETITALEWVKEASVRRVWPDTIVLSLTEQTPAAIWNNVELLNEQGDVFSPEFDNKALSLPYLSGVNSDSQKVLNEQRRINGSLEGLDISVEQLSLAEHGSWFIVMSNGIGVKAGNELPEKKLHKSLTLLSTLEGDLMNRIKVIDLRYPNGVSVTWKEGVELGEVDRSSALLTVKKDQPKKG